MTKKLSQTILWIFMIGLLLPCVAETRGVTTVKVSLAPVFREPSEHSEQVTQVLLGDVVAVTKINGGWAKVLVTDQYRTSKGYPGWIKVNQLTRNTISTEEQPSVSVIVPTVRLRTTPERTGATKVNAYMSTRLELDSSRRTVHDDGVVWLPVLLPGHRADLWVPQHAVSDESVVGPGEGDKVIDAAKLFRGTPYLWGGMSHHGIDCSGLVYSVYRINGITVPRDADQQYQVGTKVSRQDLEPGDMVFFGGPGDITHVGLYAGSGKFIHASSGGGVLVSRLFQGWYLENYQGARRIITPQTTETRSLVPRTAQVSR